MKKKKIKSILFALAVLALVSAPVSQAEVCTKNETCTVSDFQNPPSSVRIACYWYWISDHISAEGVVNDLRAMKEAGITLAYIGNIGLDDDVYGPVKFGSDEWWHILHTAMKTATELDIQLGMFNSPGWSQSGGPWVKPEQAMRYLTFDRTEVTGGKPVSIVLSKPEGDYQDVKLLAYPVLPKNKAALKGITTALELKDGAKLIDGDTTSGTKLAADKDGNITMDLTLSQPEVIRTVKIYAHNYNVNTRASFQVKQPDGTYTTLSEFKLDRYNSALNVGFAPLAPIVISVPPTRSADYRLVVNNAGNVGLAEIELSTLATVERYPEKSLAKMFQEPLPYWHEYQWKVQPAADDISQVVDSAQVLDISKYLSGDKLEWNAPAGNWEVVRIGAKPTGVENSPASKEATGLEVDKMSRKHVAAHFDAFMGEILRRIPAEDRKCWTFVVEDSYEMGGQNYTDTLFNDFQKRYGYDPIPFLPTLDGVVVQSQDISDRFLWDLRRLIADKVAYDYVGGLREISNKHGLKTWLENYGHWGFPSEFLLYGSQSDEIGGEYWFTGTLGDIENRASSSCGHIYGKKRIWAESFTSGAQMFTGYPEVMKPRGDRFFTEGINSTLLHVYIQQAYEDRQPGVNAWFGSEFNRFSSWYPQLHVFNEYLRRVNFILQSGLNVADVAYFIGEDAPKMTGITNPALPKGYQFDYINADVIENSLTVKDGIFTLPHGTQYKILVLPQLETMRPKLLRKIKSLIEQGGIVLGPAPRRSPSYQDYPRADLEVWNLSDELWGGDNTYNQIGKGLLIKSGVTMEEALNVAGCPPDMRIPADVPALYTHRTLKDMEIYFVSNQSNRELTFSPEFRVKGMRPECWYPTTGEVRPLAGYETSVNGTIVPLRLHGYESVFIVFKGKADPAAKADVEANYPRAQKLLDVTAPWTVDFDNPYMDFKKTVTMDKLINLNKSEDKDLKYYSGTIRYSSTFDLDAKPAGTLYINLHEVHMMAKVKINGHYAGGVWTSPHRLDITDFVKVGKNTVEVEIVNTWANRVIGDMNLPENERKIWMLHNGWSKDSPVPDSGLVGPVVLETVTYPVVK
ncbi:MAG: glycoside hydrolase family 2 [Verrucomicrobia bacterium]|nr:glycoside hydrolase family 2 [Verrucomicrobiota bacterium]